MYGLIFSLIIHKLKTTVVCSQNPIPHMVLKNNAARKKPLGKLCLRREDSVKKGVEPFHGDLDGQNKQPTEIAGEIDV